MQRCKQGHDSPHGHPSDGEYVNPSNAVDSIWGSNLQHGSNLREYYPHYGSWTDDHVVSSLFFASFATFSWRKRNRGTGEEDHERKPYHKQNNLKDPLALIEEVWPYIIVSLLHFRMAEQ